MLAALDARPGMSVLEIGTGRGYNAALLAARLGAATAYYPGGLLSLTVDDDGTLSYSTDTYDMRQAGPRQLWDKIETAHQWRIDIGKPDLHSWQFTVTPNGQRIEQTAAKSDLPGVTG